MVVYATADDQPGKELLIELAKRIGLEIDLKKKKLTKQNIWDNFRVSEHRERLIEFLTIFSQERGGNVLWWVTSPEEVTAQLHSKKKTTPKKERASFELVDKKRKDKGDIFFSDVSINCSTFRSGRANDRGIKDSY